MYDPQVKKKTTHDLAYLIVLLVTVVGIFLFAIIFVNSLFSGLLRGF